MSWEQLGLWGCERSGYLDLWNNARTLAYIKAYSLEAQSIPLSANVNIQPALIADGAPAGLYTFTNPVTDNVWWYDALRPESAGFLGLQVTRVDGIESNVITQENDVILNKLHTLAYRKRVNKGFTITVEGVITGLTPYSLDYGLRALRKKLEGCCPDGGCGGTRMRLIKSEYVSAASCSTTWTPPSQATVSPFRNVFNVKQAEQPSVITGWTSPIARKITFTLRSQGELYLDRATLLASTLLQNGDCSLGCSPTCVTYPSLITNPSYLPNPLPVAPNQVLPSSPPIVAQQWKLVTMPSNLFDSELEASIYAGSLDLFGITVKAWPYNPSIPYTSGLYNDCNVCRGFSVQWVPAKATWSRQVCNGTYVTLIPRTQDARGSLYDTTWTKPNPSMRYGGGQWLLSIEADSGAAANASITLYAVGVEP